MWTLTRRSFENPSPSAAPKRRSTHAASWAGGSRACRSGAPRGARQVRRVVEPPPRIHRTITTLRAFYYAKQRSWDVVDGMDGDIVVRLRVMSGPVFALRVDGQYTVAKIKELLERRNGIPVVAQDILLDDCILPDGAAVGNLHLTPNSLLVVHVRQHGGVHLAAPRLGTYGDEEEDGDDAIVIPAEAVRTLAALGFADEDAIAALRVAQGDLDMAASLLYEVGGDMTRIDEARRYPAGRPEEEDLDDEDDDIDDHRPSPPRTSPGRSELSQTERIFGSFAADYERLTHAEQGALLRLCEEARGSADPAEVLQIFLACDKNVDDARGML